MKYLQNAQLECMSNALCTENGEVQIQCKLESYSCKMTSDDKRQFKLHSHDAPEYQALSPPQAVYQAGSPVDGCLSGSFKRSVSDAYNSSSLPVEGMLPFVQSCDVRTLYYLIATMNASFQPDYDFSNAKSNSFSREPSYSFVASAIRTVMSGSRCEQFSRLESPLWKSIGTEVDLSSCEIYSYNPDLHSDPYSEEGNLWSFNYFFFDTKQKRIVFFSCRATSVSGMNSQDESGGDFEDEIPTDWTDEFEMDY
ncbi:repressor of RNA polymerase III transcription MAF1 homolog [Sycon ciliatum]|uniref:repressor of RNA polymerase III transcription MAF1 homolog n=1 Tax=Sycon ciliatum TaxID=27933 RepID=UPI0020ACC6D5|eukprot:scpid66459/ scgid21276/ Repressor of RNA polymerase III transcription MAF1 homolog